MQIRNYRKDFYDTYTKKVFPILINMEDERKQYLRNFKLMPLYFILAEIITIIIFVLLYPADRMIPADSIYTIGEVLTGCITAILNAARVICLLAIIIVPTIFLSKRDSIQKEFKTKVKEQCLNPLLKVLGDVHKSDNIPDIELLQNSKLFGFDKITALNCDDNFTGIHKGVNFQISEIHLGPYGTDKEYKGILLIFPSNKKIEAQTTIIKKNSTQSLASTNRIKNLYLLATIIFILAPLITTLLGLKHGLQNNIYLWIFIIIPQFALLLLILYKLIVNNKYNNQDIHLEDASFNKYYEIVSENQIEARYLITPAFIERFKNLQTAFQSNEINCSFFKNKIMFAIKTDNDAFELVDDLKTPLSKTTQIQKFLEEIVCVYEMIDHFKLNEKTGL